MSEIRLSSEKRLRLFAGRGFPELAEEVATELGIPLTPTSAYDFANGEIFVRFEESVRGSDAFVLQSHSAPVNKQIMEQLIMVDALKRASAKRITVVAPFYGYARQDKKHRGREPISARLMADLFKTELELRRDFVAGRTEHVLDTASELKAMQPILASLLERAKSIDSTLEASVLAEQARWTKGLERLAKKMKRAEERNQGDEVRQVLALKETLFPDGEWQERRTNFLEFASDHPHFIADLLQTFDPLHFEFYEITL